MQIMTIELSENPKGKGRLARESPFLEAATP
jgi:hypothetical protein